MTAEKVSSTIPTIPLRVINEGEEPYEISPSDSYTVTMGTGKQFKLKPLGGFNATTSTTIAPYRALTLYLSVPNKLSGPIESLTCKSRKVGGEVEVRTPYAPPVILSSTNPIYPPEALVGRAPEPVLVAVRIDSAGLPTRVEIAKRSAERYEPPEALQQAAIDAVRNWIFRPALLDGAPVDGFYETMVLFPERVAVRGVLPLPLEKTEQLLARMLSASFPKVVPLPRTNSFIIAERPQREGSRASARLFLLSYGEQAHDVSSWLWITSIGARTRTSSECSCHEGTDERKAPGDLLQRISGVGGIEPTGVFSLAPQRDLLTLGGPGASEADRRWNGTVLRDLLYRILDKTVAKEPVAHGGDGDPLDVLNEVSEDQLVTTRPSRKDEVALEAKPPELTRWVQPDYPEMARRARIQGKVTLSAVIDSHGAVRETRVVRSIPLLDNAAIQAVCCWGYRPAMENGQPVSVDFTVVVEFTLRD